MKTARYAIYFSPAADSSLAALGNAWLGRDCDSGLSLQPPSISGLTLDRWSALTEAPRRYGFHATLKPPFHLAPGASEDDVRQSLHALATRARSILLPRLDVRALSRFLALVPSQPTPELQDLAARSVRDLDRLRAQPAPEELERRRRAGLTERQETLLGLWGYPYVMEAFRFHMTLTGQLTPDQSETLLPILTELFAPELAKPQRIDALSLFEQPEPGANFRRIDRIPLSEFGVDGRQGACDAA